MAGKYRFQAKATEAFGVVFRSKLEAAWAYEFTNHNINWDYADSHWHDFVVDSMHVEIKPQGISFLHDAISRAWHHSTKWREGLMLFIQGEPGIEQVYAAQREECGNCASVFSFGKFSELKGHDSSRMMWDKSGFFGRVCEHGCFHKFKSPIKDDKELMERAREEMHNIRAMIAGAPL